MINIDFLTVQLNTLNGPIKKGYTMIICNNVYENIELIKHSDPNDFWFHSCISDCNINIILKNHGEFISKFYLDEIKKHFNKDHKVMFTKIKNLKFKDSLNIIFPENISLL
jgi:23S rRNA U2552 (ribose-2'-O)-methylase RlmE/FtsJ